MVKGVDADLMALPGHAADQLLIALKAVSQQKEGGGHLPQGQLVQKAARSGRPGPVVEGEGHHRHLRLDLHLRAAGGCTVPGRLGSGGEGQREAQHQQGPADPVRTMIPQKTHLVFHKIAYSRRGSASCVQRCGADVTGIRVLSFSMWSGEIFLRRNFCQFSV